MGNVTLERAAVGIDEQLARYFELAEERRALVGRIQKAGSQKQSVKENIFQRVFDEYERELKDLEDELEPLAKSIEDARASLRGQIRDVEALTEALRDTLDELSFRFRVGEFEESVLNEKRAPFAEEYERLAQRHRELSESLARIASCDAAPEPRETAREREKPEAPPSPRAEPDAPRATPDVEESFVDPTDWVGEFVPEDPPSDPVKADPKPAGTADAFDEDASRDEDSPRDSAGDAAHAHHSISELADPGDESVEETNSASERRETTAGTYSVGLPILTISKGPGTGKSLPLLPMTMTLGREVDNNIEIRDMNVARYHARISFEAGTYVIQNLEGSPGTFVDGERITKAALDPGAVIRVGDTELKFNLG